MSKITIVVGHKVPRPANWDELGPEEKLSNNYFEAESFHRRGHWKKETISKLAKQLGYVGEATITHTVLDLSGKGRTYNKYRYEINLDQP